MCGPSELALVLIVATAVLVAEKGRNTMRLAQHHGPEVFLDPAHMNRFHRPATALRSLPPPEQAGVADRWREGRSRKIRVCPRGGRVPRHTVTVHRGDRRPGALRRLSRWPCARPTRAAAAGR
ncbi:hypothetical protein SUDANB146_05838 [Streptomyces sp. enrichment culture]